MIHVRTILPYVITTLAIALTSVAIAFHTSNQRTYVHMAESGHLSRGWDREVAFLAFEDFTGTLDPALPCPALITRDTEGRYDTYRNKATITRAHIDALTGEPTPTCDDTPHYLIELEMGWSAHPTAMTGKLVMDGRAALEEPQLLMQPFVRQDQQPFTITDLGAQR